MSTAFKIREATGKDLSFIYDTWLNSYRYDSFLGKSCRNGIYFENYKRVIDSILSDDQTTVLVAHSPDNENLIFAYLVQNIGILHYMFCKEAYRGFGLARALFKEAFGSHDFKVDYTHRTGYVSKIVQRFPNLTHNPFHLYKGAS